METCFALLSSRSGDEVPSVSLAVVRRRNRNGRRRPEAENESACEDRVSIAFFDGEDLPGIRTERGPR